MNRPVIDAHQHLWMPSEREYSWIPAGDRVLNTDLGPDSVAPHSIAAGISGYVLVQAADTYEDTFYMLSVARQDPRALGVVGWVPLDRPDEARAAIQLYARDPLMRGVRALTHTYPDPSWILRDEVGETLRELERSGLTLDYVVSSPHGLAVIVELARAHPGLRIVVDHCGKPEISEDAWEPWASLIAECADAQNVHTKISGLSTSSRSNWGVEDWKPYADFVVDHFSSARVMMGSDWPVLLLAADFAAVWEAQLAVISHLSSDQQADILHGTAERFY